MAKDKEAEALQKIDNAAFKRDAEWLAQLIEQAQRDRFHGKLTIIIEKGLVQRVLNERSLMPPRREDYIGGN